MSEASGEQRREVASWAYQHFRIDVSAILYRLDPFGIGHPMPGDEYGMEADRLLGSLSRCKTAEDVAALVSSSFSDRKLKEQEALSSDLWWALELYQSRMRS